jgi:hypothetical protein
VTTIREEYNGGAAYGMKLIFNKSNVQKFYVHEAFAAMGGTAEELNFNEE